MVDFGSLYIISHAHQRINECFVLNNYYTFCLNTSSCAQKIITCNENMTLYLFGFLVEMYVKTIFFTIYFISTKFFFFFTCRVAFKGRAKWLEKSSVEVRVVDEVVTHD